MEVRPASTVAPEGELEAVLKGLEDAFWAKHDQLLLRENASVASLLKRAHRFVTVDEDGLVELAKELTRLFSERVEVGLIVTAINHPKGEKKPASLKALEKLVAFHRDQSTTSAMLAPLFGIYELRSPMLILGPAKLRVESSEQVSSIVIRRLCRVDNSFKRLLTRCGKFQTS
jgi:hypothetical protein